MIPTITIPHEAGCASVVRWENDKPYNGPCNCSRREMIADIEAREHVAAVLYQCVGVLADDHPKRELLLDTLSWLKGSRDERPDFEALLPFRSELLGEG